MSHSKKWSICCLVFALVILTAAGAMTTVIDPFFHYHAPLDGLQYPIDNQRYQNDGIVKHFSYDALITGTSMTENFKTSEFDTLFGVNSIKVSYSGGTYEEITDNLQRALVANPGIRLVLFGMDEWFLLSTRDLIQADGEYPNYLYDDNLFNDVEYVFNKEILCSNTVEVLDYTADGNTTTSFDDYSNWHSFFTYNAGNVLSNYTRAPRAETAAVLTEELAARLSDNILENAVKMAREHPDVQFLYFFPPYSILNWDGHNQEGTLQRQVDAFILASRLLLEEENIQLFSFYNDYDTVTNLDLYRDIVHHSEDINSLLLQRMHDGEYRLTKENYEAHWQEVLEYYSSYDYEALLQTGK